MSPNSPVHTLNHGPVHVSIWQNGGSGGPFYDVAVSRSYKGKEGWASTSTFRHMDLPVLAKAVLDAHSWIQTQKHQGLMIAAPDATE